MLTPPERSAHQQRINGDSNAQADHGSTASASLTITATAILAAIATGVLSTAPELGKNALLESYQALKALLKKKFGDTGEVAEAVERLEKKPTSKSRQEEVQEALAQVKADEDPEIRQAAQALRDQVNILPGGERHIQQATGSYIAQAQGNSTASVNVYQDVRPRPVDPAVLATARQRLTELPLDLVPAPGSASMPARLPPFARTPLFVGRQVDMVAIAALLKAEAGATVVITAMGGMGKSQLACEVLHRYGSFFAGGVFWLNCADPAAMPTEVAACRVGLRDELRLDLHTLPLDEQVPYILAAWQSELPRLLIFDNCEDEDLLAQWRPPLGNCRLLVTSRRAVWTKELAVHPYALGELKRDESSALLGTYRPDLTPEERGAIADALGDLPLALSLAGSYLEEYQDSPLGTARAYLAAFARTTPLEHPSLQQEGTTYSTRHLRNVARTFAISYERLDASQPTDATAIRLAASAAYFAPGIPIPRSLLRATLGPEEDEALEGRAVGALRRLAALGLLDTQPASGSRLESSYRLHRLLAAFLRLQSTRPLPQRQGLKVLHRLLAAFLRLQSQAAVPQAQTTVEQVVLNRADQLHEGDSLPSLLALLPHLREVTNAALARNDEHTAALCTTLGWSLSLMGAYIEALPPLKQALVIRQRLLGDEHLDTATSYNNLALLYRDLGRYEQAEPLLKQALAISQRTLGDEHPTTATCYNNLALLYQVQGRYEQAEPLYQQALAIQKRALGDEHPDTAISYNNLAMLYQAMGRYEQAEPLLKQALAIQKRALGDEHPATAISYNNVAAFYQAQGRYEQAEPLYQQALAIQKRALGDEHPATAISYNNLAMLYYTQRRYEEAEPLLKQALAISQRTLGDEHPTTATCYNNLALLYQVQGRYEQAEPLYQQALTIRQRLLGDEHPDTATNYNNLALLYKAQGRYEQAEPLYQQALAIRQRLLGDEHPDTAQSYNNLAAFYQAQGRYEQAEPLLECALLILEQNQGKR